MAREDKTHGKPARKSSESKPTPIPAIPLRPHRASVSGPLEGPRSPPNPKNTAHVPCKFYRLGQCQAGNACPFAHTLVPSSNEVCKYFQKGNCKFGHKCALAHVLPNGRCVNRPIEPQYTPYIHGPEAVGHHASPLEFSPPQSNGHLHVMDAPLPASFDSQGISFIARHGPMASSMPPRFGLERPKQDTNPIRFAARVPMPDPGGFDNVHLSLPNRHVSASVPRTRIRATEWEDDSDFTDGEETDYIPVELHDQILTPQERMRRWSRHDSQGRENSPSWPFGQSPSRFEALFSRKPLDQAATSPFGHVGSPLRRLHPSAGAVSMLSQGLRVNSQPERVSPRLRTSSPGLALVQPSMSSSSHHTDRIDEDVFPLEEEAEDRAPDVAKPGNVGGPAPNIWSLSVSKGHTPWK